jgi:predicted nucleic acid-binding protein
VILFVESSSMVKLYVEEADSEFVGSVVAEADRVAASWAAYVEVRAALAAARRAGRVTAADYRVAVGAFDADWERYARVEVSASIVRLAGDLAERHGLRGYDAVHLASAARLRDLVDEGLVVLTHDADLRTAVESEGLSLISLDAHPGANGQ